MLYTLAHAKDLVAPFAMTGGACPSSEVVVNRVNEAQRRLLSEGRADWDSTQRHVRLCTKLCCVTLPREFETARLVAIDAAPRLIFPVSYQYLENGPGVQPAGNHYGKDLLDMGDGWPTFFDIPSGGLTDYYLFFASTDVNDAKLYVTVYGRRRNGDELLRVSGVPGLDVPIAHWAGGSEGTLAEYPTPLSAVPVHCLNQVVLPAGRRGYVTAYAVDPITHAMHFLSKYHPSETHPSYRRYKLLGCDECDTTVQMLAKVRHVPLSREDDVLLVQNLDAIKTMVMAIREENSGNIEASLMLESKAQEQLSRQLANKRSGDPIVNFEEPFGIGGSPNII